VECCHLFLIEVSFCLFLRFKLDEKALSDHFDKMQVNMRHQETYLSNTNNGKFRELCDNNRIDELREALNSDTLYNYEFRDDDYRTPIMRASYRGFHGVVKLLCEKQADVNARDRMNQTGLMFAAERGHIIIVRMLLSYGAKVNIRANNDDTALLRASIRGYKQVMDLLIEKGANLIEVKILELCYANSHPCVPIRLLTAQYESHVAELQNVVEETLTILSFRSLCTEFLIKHISIGEEFYGVASFECPSELITNPHAMLMLMAVHMFNDGKELTSRLSGPCSVRGMFINSEWVEPIAFDSGKTKSYMLSVFQSKHIYSWKENYLRIFIEQDPGSLERIMLLGHVVMPQ